VEKIMVERIMEVVAEYGKRLRGMQYVPKFSYGRGLLVIRPHLRKQVRARTVLIILG
jgi:hypothetical protein